MNTVVQTVIREQISKQQAARQGIEALLWHVERWLRAPMELGASELVNIMRSHAERLLSHIEALGTTSARVALLYGNLAGSYLVLGDQERAEQLLLRELAHIAGLDDVDPILEWQTRFHLAALCLQRRFDRLPRGRLTATFHEAIRHLEHVLVGSRELMDNYPQAAVRFAIDARMLFGGLELTAERPEIQRLAAAFSDLESRLPASVYSKHRTELQRAETLLQDGEYAQAEQCCRALLEVRPTAALDSQVRRRLIEALASQHKWNAARQEILAWKHSPLAPRLYLNAVLEAILNVGFTCAMSLLVTGPGPLDVLDELLTWPDIDDVLGVASESERARLEVLRAVSARQHGEAPSAAELDRICSADLGQPHPTAVGWILMRKLLLGT